jgi:hypothetical protein
MSTRQNGKRLPLGAFALAALLLGAAIARADEAQCQKQETDGLAAVAASAVIPVEPTSLCYGAADENHSLTKEIRALVDATPPAPGNLSLALQKLASRVQDDELYGAKPARDEYAGLARSAAAGIEGGVGPGTGSVVTAKWHVSAGQTSALPAVNVGRILDDGCGQTPPGATPTPACQKAINESKAWLRVFQLTERTLTQYSAPALNAILQRSTARLAMWHAYRDDGLPQFQWEWLLNSWRLNKADKGRNGRERDKDGQPIGPMKVPTDQIIFLHPGVGLEYRDKPNKASGSDDSKTSPIVYLELIGRNRWSWNESTGQMIGGSGVSIIATYADRNHDTKVGYGLQFHSRLTKNYTLGITRTGDTTSVVFNADLAEFFKDKMAYWKGVEEMSTK